MIETADLLAFARVVELRSLTHAAHALGIPKSTVSRRLTRLERELGTRLLHRTTHGIAVTDHGTTFFEYASRSLGLLRDGTSAIRTEHDRPRGVVRLALPAAVDRELVAPALAACLLAHPEVGLSVSRCAGDPFREGYDLAIVIDSLPQADPALTATRLGTIDQGLYAAPDYVERHGLPQSHADLTRFDLIAEGGDAMRGRWTLTRDGAETPIDFQPRLACDDPLLARRAMRAGLGIAMLSRSIGAAEVAERRAIEVLPDWRSPSRTLFMLFAHVQPLPPRIRAPLDFLVDRLRQALTPASAAPTP